MKVQLLIMFLIISINSMASEVVFEGQLENSNENCKVSTSPLNAEYNLNTIKFQSPTVTMSFHNSPLIDGELPPITKGLFTYSNGHYSPIIGIPIFAIGRYYRVEMQKTENDILLKVDTMLAGVFDWIKIWSKTYRCF